MKGNEVAFHFVSRLCSIGDHRRLFARADSAEENFDRIFERNFQRNSRDKNSFDLFLHASRRLTRLILSVSSFNLLASEKVNSWRVFRGKFRR